MTKTYKTTTGEAIEISSDMRLEPERFVTETEVYATRVYLPDGREVMVERPSWEIRRELCETK